MSRFPRILSLLCGWVAWLHLTAHGALHLLDKTPDSWPASVREARIQSSLDKTLQPVLLRAPKAATPRPLLVALHTWSGDYLQKSSIPYAEWCVEKDWAMVHPNFRGPNRTQEAMGSEWVVADILDAVKAMRDNFPIDSSRIYLVGASGGGYATLLMAAKAPDLWAAASAWVPIENIATWHRECKSAGRKYAQDIEMALGGAPDPGTDQETAASLRSPSHWLSSKVDFPLSIQAGIHDGHQGSVPIGHSIRAFNLLASPMDRISEQDLLQMETHQVVPEALRFQGPDNLLFGNKKILLQQSSGSCELTLFEGGHEIIVPAALHWLEKHVRHH